MSTFANLWQEFFTPSWNSFTAVSAEEAEKLIKKSLDTLNYTYTMENITMSSLSRFMLGAYRKPVSISVKKPKEIRIEIYSASGDPAFRFAQTIFGSPRVKSLLHNICVMKIKPVREEKQKSYRWDSKDIQQKY